MAVRVVSAPWVLLGARAAEAWIADGAVALDGEVIRGIGRRLEVEARFGPSEHLDAVLLPALVNAHTHLELPHLAGRVPGGEGGLPGWIARFVRARASAPPPDEAAIDGSVEALVRAGVAAVGDVTNTLAALPALARHGLAGTLFHEVFGLSLTRIEAALARARDARARAGAAPAGLAIAPSPHAVYSTHPETLATLLRAGPTSIHLAEDPAERQLVRDGAGPLADLARALGDGLLPPRARSPVAAVAPCLGPRSLVVHAVDLDDEDRAELGASGATVVLCPRSNLHISGRLPDLPALLEAGLPLAVGTDSLASSRSLSPLAELWVLRRAYPDVPPRQLLALAWNGAAVGAPWVGALTPGAAPGVIAARLGGERPEHPAAWLLERCGGEERPFTWVARARWTPPSPLPILEGRGSPEPARSGTWPSRLAEPRS